MHLLETYWIEILLLGGALLSWLTKNQTLLIALLVLFALRLLRATSLLTLLAKSGMNWGILLLTIGLLAPIALGKYQLADFQKAFSSPIGWIAILAGIAVALLGARGIHSVQTDLVTTIGVITGTFLGVAFFHGSPMGPLIGSGMATVVVTLLRCFIHI